jgi:hypothetical protein
LPFNFDDHGGRQGNTVHALAQWQHPEASSLSEALDVLHWVMHITLHHHNAMVIKSTSI